MCICSKNSDPEHLDETKIFLIVIFHVFIFRKWPNSLLEFSILERFEYLTVLMIIIPCYSGETEPIQIFHFSFDSKCVLYSAIISTSNKKSVRTSNVSMSNQDKGFTHQTK